MRQSIELWKDGSWRVQANSVLIPVHGRFTIRGKDYKPGDIIWPKEYERDTTKTVKIVPEIDTCVLELPFLKYVVVNHSWRLKIGDSTELLV